MNSLTGIRSLIPKCGNYPRMIILGDDHVYHSMSCVAQPLALDFNGKMDVLNRGYRGYNTPLCLEALKQILPLKKPSELLSPVRLMILWVGLNDSQLPKSEWHTPVGKFKDYVEEMINYPGFKLHNTKLILVTPTPINEFENRNYKQKTVLRYVLACKELATKYNLPVVDIWARVMKYLKYDPSDINDDSGVMPGRINSPLCKELKELTLQMNGIASSPIVYTMVYKEIIRILKNQYPSEHPVEKSYIFPNILNISEDENSNITSI